MTRFSLIKIYVILNRTKFIIVLNTWRNDLLFWLVFQMKKKSILGKKSCISHFITKKNDKGMTLAKTTKMDKKDTKRSIYV